MPAHGPDGLGPDGTTGYYGLDNPMILTMALIPDCSQRTPDVAPFRCALCRLPFEKGERIVIGMSEVTLIALTVTMFICSWPGHNN